MGITGLIPFLEKASSKINIKDLKGCTVAVDTYCWLHRGAYGCADKISRGESTNIHILYCLKFVNMLLSYNIKPVMVFDGRHLPAKTLTENRRRESRNQAKKKAAELLRLGQIEEAKVQMRRCIDITHEMVLELIHECRNRNVDCIVAPYEADAQLAYLNRKNIAQYVVTEDSDLTLFGANKILFKLDLAGNCLLVEANKLHLAMGCKPEKYSFDKFRNMCILSGCDYLDSLPGIGLAKACKFILRTEETDMRSALKKLPRYLNMRNLDVNEDYIEEFLKAEATFKHMYVYDPFEREMVRLNEIPNDMKDYQILCSNAGLLLDNETSFNLALGNLNPFTLKEVDNWQPHFSSQSAAASSIKKSKHSSIWESNYKPHAIKKQASINAFTFKKINYSTIDDSTNSENEIKDECVIVSLYSQGGPPAKKNRNSGSLNLFEKPESCLIENEKKHNPFAKTLSETSELTKSTNSITTLCDKNDSVVFRTLEPLSKFKRTVIDNDKEVKSRFFVSNAILIQKLNENNTGIIEPPADHNCDETLYKTPFPNMQTNLSSPAKMDAISIAHRISDEDLEENDLEKKQFECTTLKCFEFNNKQIAKNSENLDIIEVSDSEISIKTEQKKIIPKVGLSRKKSSAKIKCDNSNSQTRLSMFGFKKKITIQR